MAFIPRWSFFTSNISFIEYISNVIEHGGQVYVALPIPSST